jgi:hypothetical protein
MTTAVPRVCVRVCVSVRVRLSACVMLQLADWVTSTALARRRSTFP